MGFILNSNLTKEIFDDYLAGIRGFIGPLYVDGSKLSFNACGSDVIIVANAEGLITIAKIIIDFVFDAHKKYGDFVHLYPSSDISLEDLDRDSQEVLIKKANFDYNILKKNVRVCAKADRFCGNSLSVCCSKNKIVLQGKSDALLSCAKELIDYAFCANQKSFQLINIDEDYMNICIKKLQ